MGKRSIIWENKLEEYIKDLHFEQRKSYKKIAEIIRKEKKISISSETVRRFMDKEISARKYMGLHGKTSQNLLFLPN